MDAATIQKIIDMTPGGNIPLPDGRTVTSKEYFNIPGPAEHLSRALEVSTLTGIVDFLKTADESLDRGLLVHVLSAQEVDVVSEIYGLKRQREYYLKATCASFGIYPFGVFKTQAEAMIGIQTQFVPTPARAELLLALGTLKDQSVKASMDDGVSQKGTFSTGIMLAEERTMPNPVVLQPYRTFRELTQPESKFVVRLQQGQRGIEVMLAEADGGCWKNEAILAIREYLVESLPSITVIA